jgi:hypothetical protein
MTIEAFKPLREVNMRIRITKPAKKFMSDRMIDNVTFNLITLKIACCLGMVMEIESEYSAPEDARGYRYFRVDDFHIFIARRVRSLDELTVDTEGFWKMKRLCLNGATIPI